MIEKKQPPQKLTLNIDGLSNEQLITLKQIHFLAIEMLTTNCEMNFFEKSSSLFQKIAQGVMTSEFGQESDFDFEGIPYAQQAIEYSIDNLVEKLEDNFPSDINH